MPVHPSVLASGLSRDDLDHALEHAMATTNAGERPTRLLVLGPARDGQLLEMQAIVRSEDLLVVQAAHARPEYAALADSLPPLKRPEPGEYGLSADGCPLTAELIASLAEDARSGGDLERLRTRLRPGRPAPLTVGRTVAVGLEADLYDLVARAADQSGRTISEVVVEALRTDRGGPS